MNLIKRLRLSTTFKVGLLITTLNMSFIIGLHLYNKYKSPTPPKPMSMEEIIKICKDGCSQGGAEFIGEFCIQNSQPQIVCNCFKEEEQPEKKLPPQMEAKKRNRK